MLAEFKNIVLNTTAVRLETIANMDINNEVIDENSNDSSLPTSRVVYEALKDIGTGGIGAVDQTYDPTSENAQSGKAVAEAISKEFEVIANALDDVIKEQKWFLGEDIPDEPDTPIEKEYKVIYHANYDGANPSFAEYVKKSTDSEVAFTIIENPFNRENYIFKGWALDKENNLNAVVYPGQTTTITEVGLIVNLYALWEYNQE